ncbi:uncharacterized protein N7484_005060 [Penicillium longicatenatum]|uniref:uncharacterized protein n=1 Tax=Penicillium longicatenatum TaxID=1561947 RepID=UPI0025474418|nr:uncharacterized protein N7484_005060 [Penicillium longicatenatum]KAJ5651337.1 hypothetical protein N7484_005060 [Penicillium longicatenatum]
MSSTTTTMTTSATATSSCSAKLYEIPAHAAACAMPMAYTNSSAIMQSCCSTASVTSYDNCDYYCLAIDQSVGELAKCLMAASDSSKVWCNTNANATASLTTSSATSTSTISTTKNSASSTSSSGSVKRTKVSMATIGAVGLLLFASLL